MRLTELFSNNGDTLTPFQYKILKRKLPLVVTWEDGTPSFRDRPETKAEAINWIKNYRSVKNYEKEHELKDLPKKLIVVPEGQKAFNVTDYLMDKFDIDESEL